MRFFGMLARGGLCLLGLGCGGGSATQSPPAPAITDADFSRPWVLRDRAPSGNPIDAIARGAAGFVALTHATSPDPKGIVERTNMTAISVDGLNWAELAIQPDGHYRSIAFANGRYIAVGGAAPGGGEGYIIASEDGRRWTMVHKTPERLVRVRYTPGGFVTAGADGAVWTSTDGNAWTEPQNPGRFMLWDANFGADHFVAVGFTMSVGTASGPWTKLECGAQLPCVNVVDPSGKQNGVLQLYTVEFGNGFFLAGGVAGLLKSEDGLRWHKVGEDDSNLIFSGGRYLRTNQNASVLADSTDGETWTDRGALNLVQTDDTCTTGRCFLLPKGLLVIPPAR